MAEDDPYRTVRDVSEPVTEELRSAGFDDAEEIGRGGFGVVYRCTQADLDRTVAVKILTADLDTENRARFFREQQAMGRLTGHPNIVTVLQSGATASGRPYLVMPYHPLDSLDVRIRSQGPLPVEAVLWIGVKIAGALESAHRLDIVHRDVKPGNILLTDYGEPALTDFGIARIAGGFQTDAGTLTGSPAFTAPEVLEGETPGPSADVYGLGATLFCALTGHAAFERRSGENVVTQFLRITTQPVPDLRESGIADDVSAVVATAMSRDPGQRPSAAALGESIRQVQRHHGYAVEDMALQAEPGAQRRDRKSALRGWRPPAAPSIARRSAAALPLELTSFIDRRTEVAQVRNRLASSRLVTLTGIGGVGKTRLALRAASLVRKDFADGLWLIELADVTDPSLLLAVVAAGLGLRDESTRPLPEVIAEFLSGRESLLVLDNCEQLAPEVAGLVEPWLQSCPDLRILATSREPLDIPGEAVFRVSPLPVPDPDKEPSLRGLPRYDAVTLFADRATAVIPDFEPTADNGAAIARICARLDGIPLAIELAAARMRTMSPEQILQRLDDRYALLTRASRTAPTRQQTLRWCVDWSYQLCDPAEQRLWARLSVFAGGFELDAAEDICGADLPPGGPLDVLSSLVDKSILIRDEAGGVVRFRMLETLREYGRQKLYDVGEYGDMRRRHRDWYQRLAMDAEAGWISDRQPYWLARLEREQPNLRDALEYCLDENSEEAAEAGLRTATALFMFWNFRGMYSEARSWIARVLDHPARQPVPDRVKALYVGCVLASMQGDLQAADSLVEQGRVLTEQAPTPMVQALIAYCEGGLQFYRGELAAASDSFERAADGFSSDRSGYLYVAALTVLGWVHELTGDTERALEYHRQVLSITEACGESLFRSAALRDTSIAVWQQGEGSEAIDLLQRALRLNRRVGSPVVAALSLEALAWIVGADGDAERAAVLMGAVQELWRSVGSPEGIFPMPQHHDECVRLARSALGTRRFDSSFGHGRAMSMDEAVSYALDERPTATTPESGRCILTKRERQVADLIAQGMTNRQIAAELVISQRTAQGHVEHILTKLGFTSRTQIAAWIAEDTERRNHRSS
ncbi:non-specific serine/threonine protein kinase [Nocardia amikacinitolerans]|uniref:protein kinase domain-containing protein n=1 Tax=Nocardia amikacinitolerans TaxID=756689 RepID=UPI00082DC266|nr:protein kinase [Nocardia amikacinitolerans]MCP2317699.1 non-specific serine/threonine protein kinase [Nocardia amikacinitolerans]